MLDSSFTGNSGLDFRAFRNVESWCANLASAAGSTISVAETRDSLVDSVLKLGGSDASSAETSRGRVLLAGAQA